MQFISRWSPAIAALCLTAACSDSQPATAPLVPTGTSAELTQPCEAELTALRGVIEGALFEGKNGDRQRTDLLLKVDAAQAKLAEGKPDDAFQKLGDIRAAVVALSTPDAKGKTKLDATSAVAINAAFTEAEACIQSVSATQSL